MTCAQRSAASSMTASWFAVIPVDRSVIANAPVGGGGGGGGGGGEGGGGGSASGGAMDSV